MRPTYFVDLCGRFLIRHYPYCNGLRVLKKLLEVPSWFDLGACQKNSDSAMVAEVYFPCLTSSVTLPI